MTSPNKTAEDVADEILNQFSTRDFREMYEWRLREVLEEKIIKALTAFRDEGIQRDRDERTADDLYRRSYERGLEEAAKIAEKLAAIETKANIECGVAEEIADRIRSLKKDVK